MVLGIADDVSGFTMVSDYSPWAVDPLFKEYDLPGIRDQLNNKRIVSRLFTRDVQHMSADGKEAILDLRVRRNHSSISLGELGRLPRAGKQRTMRASYRLKWHYGRVFFSGPSLASSRTSRGAFASVMDLEMQGMIQDRGVDDNRMYWGDGSGVRAVVVASDDGADSVTCINPGGFTNPGPGSQYIAEGMLLGFADATTGELIDVSGTTAWEVESVTAPASPGDPATVVFVGNIPASPALDGALIVRVSQTDVTTTDIDSTSLLNEHFGLAAIVGDGNPRSITGRLNHLGNIDATGATSPGSTIWQSPVIHNNGEPVPFNSGLFDQALALHGDVGDGTVNLFLTSSSIRMQFLHELVAHKMFVNVKESADGSFKAVTHNDLPVIVDRDATRGRVYGIDTSSLFCFDQLDYHWRDGDGSVLMVDPDRDAYSALLMSYRECGTDARNRNVLIKDIADS